MRERLRPQRLTLSEFGFGDDYAEAQRLVSEGNRLIAQDIANSLRGLWRRAMRWLEVGQRRHLPPT
jgi:hypothetical protein